VESSSHCYVAFLDILGFKQLVQSTKHEDLLKLYSNLFITNAAMAVTHGAYKVVDAAATKRIAIPDFSNAKIDCMVISDSVLMYTKDDSIQSFLNLCVSAGKLTMSGFVTGLPMRGSIALGPLSALKQQETDAEFGVYGLVGMALVKAYSNESMYNWAGCVLDAECIERYEYLYGIAQSQDIQAPSIADVVAHGILLQYKTPRKGSLPSEQWVINWPRFNRSPINQEVIQRSFEKYGKNAQNESELCKLRNTLDFLAHSNSRRQA